MTSKVSSFSFPPVSYSPVRLDFSLPIQKSAGYSTRKIGPREGDKAEPAALWLSAELTGYKSFIFSIDVSS
jgi:hypothetical protein